MNEVSCRTTAAIIRSLAARGLDPERMTDGLPFGIETLESDSARISWDDYLSVLENCSEILGGPDAFEEICSTFYPQNDGLLQMMASQVLSPRVIYEMGARWYGPSLYPCTRAHCEDLSDGRLRQTIEILPGHRDSDLFFRAMCGGMRTVPAMLGLPPAAVKMERAPRKGIYTITPPRVGRVERLRNLWRRRREGVEGAEEELTIQFEELKKGYEQARNMSAELDAKTRRLLEEREERERVEQMLLQAQKLDAMGRLAGGIAHDFNNVLTAISGYAELSLDQLEDDHPVHDDVEEIRAMAERGAALVKQILAFSRRQEVAPQPLELNGLTLRMESLLGRLLPESVDLEIVPSAEPLVVTADPGQLEQIVVNLVVNGRDAMPGGGPIRLELSEWVAEDRARFARLVVKDTGRGMDLATRLRAFEPFFTTKARGKGTGLGLSTVHGIVRQSGGRIDLVSEVGQGTRVTIDWPLAPEAVEAGLEDAMLAPPGGSETVLVVEDDATVRGVIERTLEAAGYTVLSSADGSGALDLARNHPTSIELLVTDVGLPNEDGAELATRIYALRTELRGALLVSGQDASVGFLTSPSNHAHLTKPLDRLSLLRATRQLLDA